VAAGNAVICTAADQGATCAGVERAASLLLQPPLCTAKDQLSSRGRLPIEVLHPWLTSTRQVYQLTAGFMEMPEEDAAAIQALEEYMVVVECRQECILALEWE